MVERILSKVSDSLKAKYYATNDSWLADCVDYCLQENNNAPHGEILEFVVSQWQLSDLREISNEKPCLPRNLSREKCTTLQGNFILQVDKVYDILESKYKQLEKIRNVANDNLEAETENDKTQGGREPKKKRMLYLSLTDGAQDVTAMEMEPIRCLNANMLPGFKLLVTGPVTCRRGVLVLESKNISEIGGEAENLLVPNALENVLARALNLEENPDPYSDIGETRALENALFEEDFDIDTEDVALIEAQSQERPVHGSPPRNHANVVPTRVAPENSVNRLIEAEREDDRPIWLDQPAESDLLFDTIDDEIFEMASENFPQTTGSEQLVLEDPQQGLRDDEDYPDSFVIDRSPPRGKGRKDEIATLEETCLSMYREFTEASPKVGPSKSCETLFPLDITGSRGSQESAATTENTSRTAQENSSRVWGFEERRNRATTTEASAEKNTDKTKTWVPTLMKQTSSSAVKVPDQPEAKGSGIVTGIKRPAAVLSSPVPNQSAGKVRCTQATPKLGKVTRKITDFLTKTHESISDLPSAITAVEQRTVKAKVTSMNKLSRNGQCWELSASITDSTGSMDVQISSQILEMLLGFSAQEFSIKKKLKKTNPAIEKELRLGFRNAENKLIELNALMEVELAPDKKPQIIRIAGLTDEPMKHL